MQFVGGAGNAVSLYATSVAWDAVYGSNGTVYLNSAQAGVAGSGDTIDMMGTSSMTQGGAKTLIKLDASDTVTLTDVTAANLTASQFRFV